MEPSWLVIWFVFTEREDQAIDAGMVLQEFLDKKDAQHFGSFMAVFQ